MAFKNNGDTMRICKVCNHGNYAWAKYCSMCGASLSGDVPNPPQTNMFQQYQSPHLQQSYQQPGNVQNQVQENKAGYGGLGLIKLIGIVCKYIIGLFKFTIRTVKTIFFAAKLLILILVLYLVLKFFGFIHSDLLDIDKLSSIYNGFIGRTMSGWENFIKSLR